MYLMPLNSTIILDKMNELIQHAAWERFWFQGIGKSYYNDDLNTKMFQFFSELGLYPAVLFPFPPLPSVSLYSD